MRLLIVAATPAEIRPLIQHLEDGSFRSAGVNSFARNGLQIDILVTGVGMVATAFRLGQRLAQTQYHLAINAGIAGVFGDKFAIGEVVLVAEDAIPELCAEEEGGVTDIFTLGFYQPDQPPFSDGMLMCHFPENSSPLDLRVLQRLPVARGITSNTIRGTDEGVRKIQSLMPADIESMEGAAFFWACRMAGVPCLQIRAISNRVGDRDKSRWEIKTAIGRLCETLIQVCC